MRNATNSIGRLLTVVVQLNDDLTELKISDAGREISPYPDLVAQAKKLYEDVATDVAPVSEVITRLEGARRVEQQLLASSGTAYSPDAAVTSSMQDSLTWAASQNAKATQYAALLAALQREGKVKVSLKPITKRTTLEQAMSQMSAADAEARNKIILDKTGTAKVQAAGIEGEAQAENIIAQAQSIQTAIRTQTDSVRDMSKQMKLRAKASRSDVRFQLAAFLTPGYYTPYAAGARLDQQRSFDQKPISYGKLQELGALSPTLDGLNTFVVIGAFGGNDRPRLDMRYNNIKWLKDKVLFERAKQLQALIIELGPTFVDLKVMEP